MSEMILIIEITVLYVGSVESMTISTMRKHVSVILAILQYPNGLWPFFKI
jgi:hypothetical protein